MSATEVAEWVVSGGLLVGIAATAVSFALRAERRAWLRVLTHRRAGRAERVAVAASVEDPAFSPEVIRASVTEMLHAAEAVWAGAESGEQRRRGDIQLIRGWAASRRGQIGNGLRIVGRPKIELVSVANREGVDEDRAVVRLHLRIHRDPKASANEQGDGTIFAQRIVPTQERWTLSRRGDRWLLAAIGGDPDSDAKSSSPLIASAAEDDERVREAALRDVAGHESTLTSQLNGLVDPALPAAAQLRELSVLDDRFSPQLLEAALRHLVAAWEDYGDGSQGPLARLATAKAVRALIHPGGGRRSHLIRDAELVDWKVLQIYPGLTPPRVHVRVEIGSAALAGDGRWTDPDRPRTQDALIWTLELEGSVGHDPEWRLVRSGALTHG